MIPTKTDIPKIKKLDKILFLSILSSPLFKILITFISSTYILYNRVGVGD